MATPHESVKMIDCFYHDEPEKAAAFLLVEGERALFVDNNTTHAVPRLLQALDEAGLTPDQVDYAIITHVHLDHAGGTAALLENCPNATVLAHPKAARHLADPSRLIEGSKAVYGEEAYARLYGTINPVPEDRIRAVEDGEVIQWGSRALTFFYTKGHASHHIVIHDSGTNAVFAGDSFGLGRMPSMRPGPAFTVCTSSPPEFDPDEARISVQRILDTGAAWAYITHYGHFDNLGERATQLLSSIAQMEGIAREAAPSDLSGDALTAHCAERVVEAFTKHLRDSGIEDTSEDLGWLARDAKLNGMGLAIFAERLRRAAG